MLARAVALVNPAAHATLQLPFRGVAAAHVGSTVTPALTSGAHVIWHVSEGEGNVAGKG